MPLSEVAVLETIAIDCPVCGRPTDLSISRPDASDAEPTSFATTRCRSCHAPFITLTQLDGRIFILDASAPPDPADPRGPTVLAELAPPPTRSGYRVTPPERLDLFSRGRPQPPRVGLSDADLHGGHAVSLSGLLHHPDGSPRVPADAARVVGWRSVWVAQLNEAIEDRLAAPPPLSFPPTIFISYRWGTDAENVWVATLARELKSRGYPVTFDRDEPGEVNVPELVSRVADCRYFVAILDPGYGARIGEDDSGRVQDGWVFDEFNTAARLSNAGQLRILGFFRNGRLLPRGFRWPEDGTPGNTVDVSTPDRLALVLDDVFPRVEGPDEATALRARSLLGQSHAHVLQGNFQEGYDCAAQLTALLPGVVDGPAQQIRVALAAGSAQIALDSAEAALTLAPRAQELLLVAGTSAGDTGDHLRAVRYLSLFLERSDGTTSAEDAIAHQALGSALDELGQVDAAVAHVELARRANPRNPRTLQTLAYILRRADRADEAAACYRDAFTESPDASLLVMLAATEVERGAFESAAAIAAQLDAHQPGSTAVEQLREVLRVSTPDAPPAFIERVVPAGRNLVSCDACAASLRVSDDEPVSLCARCGASQDDATGLCPCCGSDGRAYPTLPVPVLCPFCRHGSLTLQPRQT